MNDAKFAGRLAISLCAHWLGSEIFKSIRQEQDPSVRVFGLLAVLLIGTPVIAEVAGKQAAIAFAAGCRGAI